jgi:hypothetical protein
MEIIKALYPKHGNTSTSGLEASALTILSFRNSFKMAALNSTEDTEGYEGRSLTWNMNGGGVVDVSFRHPVDVVACWRFGDCARSLDLSG